MRRASGKSGIACLVLAAALLATLGLWRGESLWNPSDGVYAMASRQFLHGVGLYDGMATSQPPLVYLVGAGLLGISDSLTMLRAGLELFGLATALLVWRAVLTLTGRSGAAVAAGVLVALLPVTLHENALLTPEWVAAPLLLGTALLAARDDRAAAAGVLAAVSCTAKPSFAVPALAILFVASARRRALSWFAGTAVVLAGAGTLLWSGAVWDGVVVAQTQSGRNPDIAGLVAQEAWSALGLVALAAGAILLRPAWTPLLRTVTALAAGGLVLGLTVVKAGTYVNATEVAEPALLVLAACAAAWLTRRPRAWRAGAAVAALLVCAQSASLLLAPDDPRPATRPFAKSGPRRVLSGDEVRRLAKEARSCPPGAPYAGEPLVAFVAHRPVPADQPDAFILRAGTNTEFRRRYEAAAATACSVSPG